MDCSPPGSSVHGDSAGKNTGVGCHALLQEIFPIQGSNPHLLCLMPPALAGGFFIISTTWKALFLSLPELNLQKLYFQIRSHSEVPGEYKLGGGHAI